METATLPLKAPMGCSERNRRLTGSRVSLIVQRERGFHELIRFARFPRGIFPSQPGTRCLPDRLTYRFATLTPLLAAVSTAGSHGIRRIPSGALVQFPQALRSYRLPPLDALLERLSCLFGVNLGLEALVVPMIRARAQFHACAFLTDSGVGGFVCRVLVIVGGFVCRVFVSLGGFDRRVWAPAVWKLVRENDIRDLTSTTNPTRQF
jgi:hypothetical protein